MFRIQAQILNLLVELQKKFRLTYLFIAHNLGVVRYISDRVAVMYLGKIIELAETNSLYENPLHPYTRALLSSVPDRVPNISRNQKEIILEGDVPNPINPPSGCRFHARCIYAKEICKKETPELIDFSTLPGEEHFSACFFAKDFLPQLKDSMLVLVLKEYLWQYLL